MKTHRIAGGELRRMVRGEQKPRFRSLEVLVNTPPSAQTSVPIQNMKGRMVTFDAKLEPIAIDTAKTNVIVVDMQNDFGTKGGMFDRAGIDISVIQKAVVPHRESPGFGPPRGYLDYLFENGLSSRSFEPRQ